MSTTIHLIFFSEMDSFRRTVEFEIDDGDFAGSYEHIVLVNTGEKHPESPRYKTITEFTPDPGEVYFFLIDGGSRLRTESVIKRFLPDPEDNKLPPDLRRNTNDLCVALLRTHNGGESPTIQLFDTNIMQWVDEWHHGMAITLPKPDTQLINPEVLQLILR